MLGVLRRPFLANLWGKVRPEHSEKSTLPTTVFHITHLKAGSQWVNAILHTLAYQYLVIPEVDNNNFFYKPIIEGKIYPTLYVTYQEFCSVSLPRRHRKFVIIRDLRDTLISLYFSIKYSHPIQKNTHHEIRHKLNELDIEDGLLFLTERMLFIPAKIQWSWLAAQERLYRYEDLLDHDEELFEEIFLKVCRLPFTRQQIRQAVQQHRFEVRTNGRPRGVEDVHAHERKGIAGDWRNYFTEKVKSQIKFRYGSLLIATGYEKDFNW
ncbi:MAG: sulfotransferase domain-containing protein [Thermogemmata sp.]|nr:sulfotransferase domain-containing protein [Thermogemmata sp.]